VNITNHRDCPVIDSTNHRDYPVTDYTMIVKMKSIIKTSYLPNLKGKYVVLETGNKNDNYY